MFNGITGLSSYSATMVFQVSCLVCGNGASSAAVLGKLQHHSLVGQQAVYCWARQVQKHHKGAYESYKVILLQVAGKTQRSPGTMGILRAQKCLKEKCALWPFPQVLEFSKVESPRSLLIYWKIIVSLEQVYLIWCSVQSRVRSILLYEKLLNQVNQFKTSTNSSFCLALSNLFSLSLALYLFSFLSKRDKQGADPGILG